MEEYGESKDKNYPRGRGYGNDYMRGGEVFGGYGYKERADYDRPRGEGTREQDAGPTDGEDVSAERGSTPSDVSPPGGEGELEGGDDGAAEHFPQDERAGGWDVPHDFVEDPDPPVRDAAAPPTETPLPLSHTEPGHASPASRSGVEAPGPLIEPTFGDTGGNWTHSRSYYVTQAQLQQRLYLKETE